MQLDRADVDLHRSTIRLHRKGGEINVLPLADTAKIEIKAYLKQRRKRSRARRFSFPAGIEESRVARSGI